MAKVRDYTFDIEKFNRNLKKYNQKIQAAIEWCQENNFIFKIVTEEDLKGYSLPPKELFNEFDENTRIKVEKFYEVKK